MTEYEELTKEIRAHGPLTEVLEADKAKLEHIARHWSLRLETLNRFRKLTMSISAVTWGRSGKRWSASISTM